MVFLSPRALITTLFILSRAQADLQSCLEATGISVIVWPWDNDYNAAKACRNSKSNSNPDVVVRATTAAQVASAVVCASSAGKQVKARSGAHGFENDACKGDVTIDTTDLDDFSIDYGNKWASFGTGHSHGQLFWKLMQQGLVLPGGTEMTVGMGLWLGGGRGLLTSLHGLAVDTIREVEFVDSKGAIRTASASENTEMFWFVRGGGGEFPGIVTKIVAQTSPMPGSVYRRECSGSTYSAGKPMLKSWTRLLRETENSNRKMFTHVTINAGTIKFDNLCFDCNGGELNWFNNKVSSAAVGGMYCSGGYSMSWEAKLREEYGINAFLYGNFMAVEYWPKSWGFTHTGSFLVDTFESDNMVNSFIDKAVNLPEVYIYQLSGDKICTDPDMAYNGCSSKWVVHYKSSDRGYFDSTTNAIANHIPCKAFYNYMDGSMACAPSGDAWLGAHVSDVGRVKRIKYDEDPYAVFKSRIDMATPPPEPPAPQLPPAPSPTPAPPSDCSSGSTFTLQGESKGFSDGNAASLVGGPNGFVDSWMGRGFNVVCFSAATNDFLSQETFDTYESTAQSALMLSFLQNIPTGSLVVILAMDAIDSWTGDKNIGSDLKSFMSTAFGASQFSSMTFRESYGLIGYKGGATPLAEQATSAGSGFVSVSASFPCSSAGSPSAAPVFNPTPSPVQPKDCEDMVFTGTSKGFDDGNEAALTAPAALGFDDSWITSRGFNVVYFSAVTYTFVSKKTFDIYDSTAQSALMLSFLQNIPTDSLVVILAMDAIDHWSGDKNIGSDLKSFMSTAFGASQFSSLDFRESYGLIGYKGGATPLDEEAKSVGSGFVTVSASILCPSAGGPSAAPVFNPTPSPVQPKDCEDVVLAGTSKGFDDGNEATFTIPPALGFDDSWITGRGFNVVYFSAATNAFVSKKTFDTYKSTAESALMLSFLQSIPTGSPVFILAMDAIDHWSGDKNLGSGLKSYMSTAFGASQFSSLDFRESYGLIGYKGGATPLFEQAKQEGSGFVTATATLTCS